MENIESDAKGYICLEVGMRASMERWKRGQKEPCGFHRNEAAAEAERLSAVCLGSVLVLGRGTRAGGGKCLCGFVWIIIRVLGG